MSHAAYSPAYAAARETLLALKKRGVALGLDRMRAFAEALGNPQDAIPCIHIAGTNGKGSVAAMIESGLRAAGWRTGLYTSPHLVRLAERIQINRQLIADDEIAAHVREMMPVAASLEREAGAEQHPSYFEFMTAMAFRHFAQRGCDIACIEVGLGGRLDATNIVTPELSVITSIGLDHCDVLGNTLADIAAEKGGIIKPGRPVVFGRLPPEAEEVLREIATSRDAPVRSVRAEFGEGLSSYPETNLPGDYQRWNAATALLALRSLPAGWKVDDVTSRRALQNVNWPARWQRFSVDGRTVIVDTSHNSEGATVLDASLTKLTAESGRRPIIVGGVLGMSRARPLVEVFCRHAREIHFVVPAQSRACRFDELHSLVPSDFTGSVFRGSIEHLFPAPAACTIGQPGDDIVVTGSVYLAGEVLARLDASAGPSESRLQDF